VTLKASDLLIGLIIANNVSVPQPSITASNVSMLEHAAVLHLHELSVFDSFAHTHIHPKTQVRGKISVTAVVVASEGKVSLRVIGDSSR